MCTLLCEAKWQDSRSGCSFYLPVNTGNKSTFKFITIDLFVEKQKGFTDLLSVKSVSVTATHTATHTDRQSGRQTQCISVPLSVPLLPPDVQQCRSTRSYLHQSFSIRDREETEKQPESRRQSHPAAETVRLVEITGLWTSLPFTLFSSSSLTHTHSPSLSWLPLSH